MKPAFSRAATVAAICLWAASLTFGAGPVETKVTFAQIPPAVQTVIKAQLAGGTLGEIIKTEEAGETTFDVEMTRVGRTRNFVVSSEGELQSMEMFFDEVPAAIKKVIREHQGKGKVEDIIKHVDQGEPTFEVDIATRARSRNMTFSADGALLEIEVFRKELPAVISATLEKAKGAGTIEAIYRSMEDGETNYDAEITQGKTTRSVTLDAEGRLVYEEEPIELSAAPAAVQTALKAALGNGRLLELDRSTEQGQVAYEAELLQDGKRRTMSWRADGTPSE